MPLPRVVVAGAGPAGLAAATALHRAGARVTVLERRTAEVVGSTDDVARRSGAVIGVAAWPGIRTLGGGGLIDDQSRAVSSIGSLVSLRTLDETLVGAAQARGIDIRFGTTIDHVGQQPDGVALRVTSADGRSSTVVGDWGIIATGGRTPLGGLAWMRQSPVPNARTGPETYVTALTNWQPTRPAGLSDPSGAFAVNDAREGVASVWVPAADGADNLRRSAAARHETFGRALEQLGIPAGDLASAPRVVQITPGVVSEAARGRLLLAGDAAATSPPGRQAGVTLAIGDGQRAAQAVLEASREPTASSAVLDGYDRVTRALHELAQV